MRINLIIIPFIIPNLRFQISLYYIGWILIRLSSDLIIIIFFYIVFDKLKQNLIVRLCGVYLKSKEGRKIIIITFKHELIISSTNNW